jgi:nicotinate-nucleotide pyrophosphorylase (carboxylating)
MNKIDESLLDTFLERGLAEDEGSGDHTSLACIDKDSKTMAELRIKDVGVLSGTFIIQHCLEKLDSEAYFESLIEDGSDIEPGQIACRLRANSRTLLLTERLLLNTIQRMSGIATLTSRFVAEVEDLPVILLDTRKTTPLLRFLDKCAVRQGGGQNYRNGLYDWIMIKDNHIEACGSIPEAIDRVNNYLRTKELDLGITIEVRNLVELHEVLETGGVDRIMLDNFEIPLLKEAVQTVNGAFETEASGGIILHNVREVALTGVDYISIGALTHSAGSLDLSLDFIG